MAADEVSHRLRKIARFALSSFLQFLSLELKCLDEDRLQQSDILKRHRSDPRCGTRGPICVVHNDLSLEPFTSVETQVINPG